MVKKGITLGLSALVFIFDIVSNTLKLHCSHQVSPLSPLPVSIKAEISMQSVTVGQLLLETTSQALQELLDTKCRPHRQQRGGLSETDREN